MNNCIQYTLKCLSGGLGVFTNIPTTTTTIDPLCYLVDCKGNFIVDCECNYIGCMCPSSPILTTTSSTTTRQTTTTTSSSTTLSTTSTTTTSSSLTSTTTSTTTSRSSTTTSTTTTAAVSGCVCYSIRNPEGNPGNPGAVIYPCGGTGPLEVTIPVGTTNYYCVVNGTVPTKQNSESELIITSCGTSCTTNENCNGCTESKISVPVGANLVSFGDSITTPNYVPGGEPFLYTSLLASDLGITSTRYALGGSGFKTLMKNANGNIVSNTNVLTELTGLNNVYNEANKSNNLPIVSHGCYTLMANQWASSIVNGASASINRVGVFTGYAAAREVLAVPGSNAFGGKYGKVNGQALPNTTDAVYTANVGAYVEYTATFKYAMVSLVGGTGVYSSYNSTTIPSGVARVYVNNVLHSTINLSQQYPLWAIPQNGFGPDDESMGPVMVPIIMPNSTSRTIKIELVSGDMAIDYIAILNNPANCYPVILGEIPYVNPSQWGVGSESAANTYSSVKQTIVNTWTAEGFPIRYCVINSPAGPYSYVNTTDGTHPNVLGNQQIKTAFRSLFV